MHFKFYRYTMSIKMLQKKSINTHLSCHIQEGWADTHFRISQFPSKNLVAPHASAKESSKRAARVLAQSDTHTKRIVLKQRSLSSNQ